MMDDLERAELELHRAERNYAAKRKQAEEAQPKPQVNPNVVRCDLDKVCSVEDIVAVIKNIGVVINFDKSNPAFHAVEHLAVDDDEPEKKESSEP